MLIEVFSKKPNPYDMIVRIFVNLSCKLYNVKTSIVFVAYEYTKNTSKLYVNYSYCIDFVLSNLNHVKIYI